ncbi:16S rRNA (cytosine(1402)-N(4))-methyltransferase RsmH [Tissierella praeacuta]|uniref:16S rRNA (cytosine(1402)-N(4))-methyltransferase RsmH n=1 Tax=Tissierella praeacuta TaxID=43131 RepID=UPI001C11DE3E|nr:16S rRNA (cytosine(1402)-N(4))-methyltransferase RsmH [Tissierella praeacuta]MBU5254636.1 16S rRNA (cytosine(1402)-N(4))-methyltransferase RsmH [Tissierella praeacuta]
MNFEHVSVLLDEVLEGLNIKDDGIYVDGTLGGAGHSSEIVKRLTTGKLIGIDQDLNALNKAGEVLKEYKDKVILVHNNYENIDEVLNELGIEKVDGILLDLGVSSHQLDEESRGFSHNKDAPLDMRMDETSSFSAWDVVNKYSHKELEKIIWDYGEERWARRIAKFIVEDRKIAPIDTTFQLVSVIKKAIPKEVRKDGHHPAKKTFQAIRIEVNRELDVLTEAIPKMTNLLNPSGRLAIITFHSLEDRIVKEGFRELYKDCICPPHLPQCICNKTREIEIITRKPIVPSKEEIDRNPRSRSAKLRIAEKLNVLNNKGGE